MDKFKDLNAQTIAAMLSITVTVIGLFWGALTKIVLPLHKIFTRLDEVIQNQEDVKKEIFHNGGSSIKDAITRIDVRTNEIQSLQHAMIGIDDIPSFRTNAKGEVVFVNTAWCDFVGLDSAEALGYGWMAAVPDELKDSVTKNMQTVQTLHFDTQEIFVFKDFNGGPHKKVRVKHTWLKDSHNEVIGGFGTLTPL